MKSLSFLIVLLLELRCYCSATCESAAGLTPITGYITVTARDSTSITCWSKHYDSSCSLPTIFIHSPYGIVSLVTSALAETGGPLFSTRNYSLIFCNWAGSTAGASRIGTDTYDIIEWVASQNWSNGFVGMYGASALAAAQYSAAAEQPPHLAAIVPLFHPAVSTYTFYYPGNVLRYDELLLLSSLGYPSASIYKSHPTYDNLWKTFENSGFASLSKIKVPALIIGGYWDHTDNWYWFEQFRNGTDHSVRNKHRLLYGPWTHFASASVSTTMSTEELLYTDCNYVMQYHALAWYDLYLKNLTTSAASTWTNIRYFRLNDNMTAINKIHTLDKFPPSNSITAKLYLSENRKLITETPTETTDYSLFYTPINPSPTIGGACMYKQREFRGPTDQWPLFDNRSDSLLFLSPPLLESVILEGIASASLDVTISTSDTDLMIRVVDLHPDNDQSLRAGQLFLIGDGPQRFKFSSGSGNRRVLSPKITNPISYEFGIGHCIGVIVSNSNFPRFDANLNTGQDIWAETPLIGFTYNNCTTTIHLGPLTSLSLQITPTSTQQSSNWIWPFSNNTKPRNDSSSDEIETKSSSNNKVIINSDHSDNSETIHHSQTVSGCSLRFEKITFITILLFSWFY